MSGGEGRRGLVYVFVRIALCALHCVMRGIDSFLELFLKLFCAPQKTRCRR
jgi:organic radical activating enzyme